MSQKKHLVITAITIYLFFAWIVDNGSALEEPKLKFIGAARSIGGSAILLSMGSTRILIDCGNSSSTKNLLPFDPATIDYLFITHAHEDHTGRVSELLQRGFQGTIIGTAPTGALVKKTMELYEKPHLAEIFGRRYLFRPYGRVFTLPEGFTYRFQEAGHILGAAIIELWLKAGGRKMKLVFSGDLGSHTIPLLKPAKTIDEGDYVVVEATHGPGKRNEGDLNSFGQEIKNTLAGGGSVLIPAFALDRTQRLIYALKKLKEEGVIPLHTPIYADSRSAKEYTRIYRRYLKEPGLLDCPGLKWVKKDEALFLNEKGLPCIILTTSGMMDHGLAPRHLEYMSGNEKNLLALVGWQAPGTLGATLREGAKTVCLPPKDKNCRIYNVRMRVKYFGVFSGHLDGCEILSWLSHFKSVKKVFLVHGEEKNVLAMAELVERNLGLPAWAPQEGEEVSLSWDAPASAVRLRGDACAPLFQ